MEKTKRRRRLPYILLILLVIAAAAAFGAWRWQLAYMERTFTEINGEQLRRDTEALTISSYIPSVAELNELQALRLLDAREAELTPEQYESYRAAKPYCEILWRVPFSFGRLDAETEQLVIESITPEDVALLHYLPELRDIDARACRDYETLLLLERELPDVNLTREVEIGNGEAVSWGTRKLVLENADGAALLHALPYLRELESVEFEGELPEGGAFRELLSAGEGIEFKWSVPLYGAVYAPDTVEIDISGMKLQDTRELEGALPYLPALERVIMCDCGISNEDMAAMGERHPEVKFVWRVYFGTYNMRTDATGFIQSKHPVRTQLTTETAQPLRYCTDLIALDLGHMLITDCSFVENMQSLKYLVLADNPLESVEPIAKLKNLEFFEVFMTRIKDYTPLTECKSIVDLNISFTHVADITPLYEMDWLEHLWFCGANLGYEREKELHEALPNTVIQLPYGSSTGSGWRELRRYYEMRDTLGMYYMVG